MAQTRGTALKSTDVDLVLYIRQSGTLTDPYEVRQVEILDTDGSTVLETIASGSISNPSTGKYQITASGTNLDATGTYWDKWYLTRESDDSEETITNGFYVTDSLAGLGRLTGSELRSIVLRQLHREDMTTEVQQWMKLAIDDITALLDIQDLESTCTFSTTSDTGTVSTSALSDDSGNTITHIIRAFISDDADSWPLAVTNKTLLDELFSDTTATAKPTHISLWGKKLYIRPIPDAAYSIILDTRTEFIYPTDDTTLAVRGSDGAVIARTAYYGWLDIGDPEQAAIAESRFSTQMHLLKSKQTKPSRRKLRPFHTTPIRTLDEQKDPWANTHHPR
jgi:hypothetical protein